MSGLKRVQVLQEKWLPTDPSTYWSSAHSLPNSSFAYTLILIAQPPREEIAPTATMVARIDTMVASFSSSCFALPLLTDSSCLQSTQACRCCRKSTQASTLWNKSTWGCPSLLNPLPQINSCSSFHHERVKPQNGYTAKHESKQTLIRVTKPSKWGCACNIAVIERVRL
jgi:hypothetical protein